MIRSGKEEKLMEYLMSDVQLPDLSKILKKDVSKEDFIKLKNEKLGKFLLESLNSIGSHFIDKSKFSDVVVKLNKLIR